MDSQSINLYTGVGVGRPSRMASETWIGVKSLIQKAPRTIVKIRSESQKNWKARVKVGSRSWLEPNDSAIRTSKATLCSIFPHDFYSILMHV